MRIVSRNIAFVEGSYCNACSEQNNQAIAERNYSRAMVFVKELQIFILYLHFRPYFAIFRQ